MGARQDEIRQLQKRAASMGHGDCDVAVRPAALVGWSTVDWVEIVGSDAEQVLAGFDEGHRRGGLPVGVQWWPGFGERRQGWPWVNEPGGAVWVPLVVTQ